MKSDSLFQKIGRFAFLIILVNIIGYIASSYMTSDTQVWYQFLPHSSLNPPNYIFAIVWGFLLFLQAVSAFLVWGKATPRWFVIQLALNMLWSFTFFYLRLPSIALLIVLLFILALIMNIKSFYKANHVAGILLIPTLLWTLFAIYLNAVIVFN
jgi:tryptophan-rich sensory protein